MKINYNVTGAERKELVNTIGEIMGIAPVYAGAGGNVIDGERYRFSYVIMNITVTQNGEMLWDDRTDSETINKVLNSLTERGYAADHTALEHDDNEALVGPEEYPDIDQHYPGRYSAEPPTEEMLKQAEAWMEGQPEFEGLQLTEREELGLGREHRDHPGEDGMQSSDVPESYTYQAELCDPDYPDRMEVFSADNDEDALRQAYEFCEGEIVLLELFEMDDDYNIIRSVEITPRTDRLTIEHPLDGFTPEKLDNLNKLVNAKAPLLMAALGTDKLPIKQTADSLLFPWFRGEGAIDGEHADAYATLVGLLCKTAIEKKRVTAKEKDAPDNPKYAMRCFLLTLGFIGNEYKTARKILLSRLDGNSSWKNGKKAISY